MRTLLIPTNFTDLSRHATDYAIRLYKKDSLKIILLNAFEQPKTGRSIQLSLIDIMKKNSEKGLDEDKLRIEEVFPDLDCKIVLRPTQGSVSSSIKSVLKRNNVDIIVMGSKGNEELMDMFVESTTANVIANVDHPMLIIPPIAKVTSLDSIILTTDCKPITSPSILNELKYLCEKNKCEVKVLKINKKKENVCSDSENLISSYLSGVNHDFNYRINSDIPTGIYKFIKETDADIVVLIKRKGAGSLIDRIFHQSVSKRIVKHIRQTMLLFTDQNY